jgi:hypothetical protein
MMKLFDVFALWRSPSARARRRPAEFDRTEEETFSDPLRWQSVTILCPPERIAPDGLFPEPLARLAEIIDIRLEPAPGDRGTELSARTKLGPRSDSTLWKGEDPARQIRTALQHAKQLLEVGEVLAVQPQPAGKRRRPGLLVGLMTGDADQEGVV